VELVFGFNPLAVNANLGGRLQFANPAAAPNFWNFFPEKRAPLSDAWGLPVLPCFPTPLVSVQLS